MVQRNCRRVLMKFQLLSGVLPKILRGQGIDKLTEKSLIYLRFVSAHKNQLIDFYRYLFFKTEQKIKNSLIFWLTCQYRIL